MSGQSPSTVLYNSSGTELDVASGSSIPTGTNTLLISGQNPSGNALYVPSASQGALGMVQMSNDFVVQSNATVTTTGSTLVTANWFGTQEVAIIVNVGTVTGSGSIAYTIQEVDPGNGTTVFGNSAGTSTITNGNAPAVFTAVLTNCTSPMMKVSWTVTGTFSASIYTTVVTKTTPLNQNVVGVGTAGTPSGGILTIQGNASGTPVPITGSITATNPSVSTVAATPPTSATYMGASVTTSAPTYTTGQMDPLSLTTAGLLRIDGVYPINATTPTSDVVFIGGAVTTAAPGYTTGQLSALSLDTSGNLRSLVSQSLAGTLAQSWYTRISDGTNGPAAVKAASTAAVATDPALVVAISPNNTVATSNLSVSATAASPPADATYAGASVTTSAPTYTTGQMDPLSLTTAGLLRIDGVYPINATTPTSDATFVAGAVTTSAPTYTTGQLSALSLDTTGNLRVSAVANKASTANVTSVAVTASAATSLLASNPARLFAALYNNTNKNIYVLLGSGTASISNFSIVLLTASYWELPVTFTGAISEFSPSSATGSVLCTELTA